MTIPLWIVVVLAVAHTALGVYIGVGTSLKRFHDRVCPVCAIQKSRGIEGLSSEVVGGTLPTLLVSKVVEAIREDGEMAKEAIETHMLVSLAIQGKSNGAALVALLENLLSLMDKYLKSDDANRTREVLQSEGKH